MKEKKPKEKNPIIEDTKKQILKNSIVAAIILLCFVGIFIAYSIIQDAIFSRVWQVLTMLLLGTAIVIFEIAYKKDNGIIAINGIEALLFACFVLTVQYIKVRFNIDVKLYTIIAGSVFLTYCFLKTFIMYTAGRKKVLNSLSDIADIVAEDAPKKKKATKHKKGED